VNNIEELLKKNKLDFDKLEAPKSLENKLRIALKDKNRSKISRASKIKAAAIFLCLILAGYNFSTLGFYSAKLTGYDKLMDANLKNLNELGKGQTISKSFTFKNGLIFTLDGIMLDDNKLLAFYTIKNSAGDIENTSVDLKISGKFNSYPLQSSYGISNNTKTEMKSTGNFNSPSILDKDLVLNIISKENSEMGKITFTLDQNKSMGHSIKKYLNKNIKADNTNLHIQYISASPTTTIIKGRVGDILGLVANRLKGVTFSPSNLDIKLLVDGKVIESQTSELSSNIDGVSFKYNFQPLPTDFKKLQIELSGLTSEHIINKNFKLKKEFHNENITVENKNIRIDKIYESNGNTYVIFSTASDVILAKVNMIIDGKTVNLNKTMQENNNKTPNTRILEFNGTGSNLQLNIQRMIYRTNYNNTIDIISN
jgi:hypothetical protein